MQHGGEFAGGVCVSSVWVGGPQQLAWLYDKTFARHALLPKRVAYALQILKSKQLQTLLPHVELPVQSQLLHITFLQ